MLVPVFLYLKFPLLLFYIAYLDYVELIDNLWNKIIAI